MRLILSILLAILFFNSTIFSYAQEDITVTPTPTPAPKAFEYELPYPGILPDNVLYPVKMLRDKIVRSFISDPQKEAEFLLLNSDKRFYAGIFLVEKNKDELALTTISKGNNYFDEAIGKVHEAQKQKKDMNPFIDKLVLSAKKHQVVLKDLESRSESKFKAGFKKEYDRVIEMEKKVSTLKPKRTEKAKITLDN